MVLIPQAIEALLTVINLICNFDILQSTAPRIFLMFFCVEHGKDGPPKTPETS